MILRLRVVVRYVVTDDNETVMLLSPMLCQMILRLRVVVPNVVPEDIEAVMLARQYYCFPNR